MTSNSIVIEDSSISLMHAKITRKNGDFFLKDLNSTNGTFVNGQPVGEARLRDADRVRFADVTTQFMADAVADASVASASPTFVPTAAAQLQPQASAHASAPLTAVHSAPPASAPRTPFNEPPPSSLPARSAPQFTAAAAPAMSISKPAASSSADSPT